MPDGPSPAIEGTSARTRPFPRFELPALSLVVMCLVTPVLTTIAWYAVYGLAKLMPEAPTGDTLFTWAPLLYPLVVGPIWLIVALCSAWAFAWPAAPHAFRVGVLLSIAGCVAGVAVAFAWLPAWPIPGDGFPVGFVSVAAALVAVVISLAPAAWLVTVLIRAHIIRGWVFAVLGATVIGLAVAWSQGLLGL